MADNISGDKLDPAPRHAPYAYTRYAPNARFGTFACPARPAAGRSSRSWLRGTQGGRVYTTVQVRGPVGVRGACSGRSKLREMALFHGIIFRDTKLPNTMESPQFQPFALLLLCHTIPSPLKLSTLGHPRYSSRRTSSCSLSDERPWTANLCVRVCHDSRRPTTYLVETNT